MSDQIASVAEAYDRQADIYDNYEIENENLKRARNEIYAHVSGFLKPDDKILEINAGTGTDAVHFGQLGYRIHATELSAGMLDVLKGKIKQLGLEEKLSTQRLSFTDLDKVNDPPYQYIFSNIGGLNCLADLTQFAKHAPQVLSPGGVVTTVIMSPICPWEWLELLRGDLKTAARRLHRDGVIANTKDISYKLYYHTPGQVRAAFGPDFQLLKLQSLSLFGPPIDRKQFSTRRPKLYQALIRIDSLLTHRYPFNHWGDFFVISLRYAP